ncbi:hypothetical protein [Embleya sp. NPDC001921]
MGSTGFSALDVVLVWCGVFAVVAGVFGALWRIARAVARTARRMDHVVDDWTGEPGRPGVPGRPGLMERVGAMEARLSRMEHELHPNDGASLRDAIDSTNRQLARLCPECGDEADGAGGGASEES